MNGKQKYLYVLPGIQNGEALQISFLTQALSDEIMLTRYLWRRLCIVCFFVIKYTNSLPGKYAQLEGQYLHKLLYHHQSKDTCNHSNPPSKSQFNFEKLCSCSWQKAMWCHAKDDVLNQTDIYKMWSCWVKVKYVYQEKCLFTVKRFMWERRRNLPAFVCLLFFLSHCN